MGGVEAEVSGDFIGGLEEGLPFADGDDELGRREGEEIAEPPDSGEVEGIEAFGPLGLELVQSSRDGEVVPVVDDIDEIGASRAGEMGLVDSEGGRAGRVDALLIGGGHRGGSVRSAGLLDHGSLGPSPPALGASVGPATGPGPASPPPVRPTPTHALTLPAQARHRQARIPLQPVGDSPHVLIPEAFPIETSL